MRCAVAAVGSRGDVEPFAFLALALAARGHEVTLALDRGYARLPSLQTYGSSDAPLRLDPLGELGWDDLVALVTTAVAAPTPSERSRAGYEGFLGRRLDELRARLDALAAAHELVIVSEPLAFSADGKLPWRTRTAVALHTFTPASDLLRLREVDCLRLAALSPLFAPRDPALAAAWRFTGFWLPPPRPIAPALQQFLDAGAAPLFLTMGSMIGFDADALARTFVTAARAVGARAIVQRGWARLEVAPGPDVLAVDEVDYAGLMRRCAALFIHGGTGTTACALHAGRPIALVPVVDDQESWARILGELGVSLGRLDARRPDADDFVAVMRRAADPACVARATAVAARLANEPGLAAACDEIERFVAR
jgi:UDP:flavonoid glycosyltransferase YjiC (YdhE family)